MHYWEVDIELRVRKTLSVGGPPNEAEACRLVHAILAGDLHIGHFLKWEQSPGFPRPLPVEAIIDNDPQITAVREVAE